MGIPDIEILSATADFCELEATLKPWVDDPPARHRARVYPDMPPNGRGWSAAVWIRRGTDGSLSPLHALEPKAAEELVEAARAACAKVRQPDTGQELPAP